ncbi:MAG TPA: extracellular solute-binding protein, partial [Stellaceae bacterium]|nr:extracellular solute-binding protein [Stellaceae bacterium]
MTRYGAMSALAVLGSIAAASTAAAADFGPHVKALIAEATKEGKLDLSWSGSGFGDNGKDLPKWIAAFNKFYGTNLAYTFAPAPSMTQQAANLVQSAQSNSPATTDVVILGADSLLTDIQANATKPYDWVALAKEIGVDLPPAAAAPGNAAVAISTEVFGIEYNKDAVPADQVPKNIVDVLKPEWKGKIASTPYAAGFNFLAAMDPKWGPDRMQDFVTKLAAQVGGLIRCGDTAPILDGQFDMLVLECDISDVIQQQRRGAPLGYVVPADAPVMDLWYMAVPKTSPDPAAGALLALFMLTKDGQALQWEDDANDLALLPGSKTLAQLPGNPDTI